MNKKIDELQSKIQEYYKLQKNIEETGRAIEDIIRYKREMLAKGKLEYSNEIEETRKELYEKLNMLKSERDRVGKEIENLSYELMGKKNVEKIKNQLARKLKFLIILLLIPLALFLTKETGFYTLQKFQNIGISLISLILTFLILKILRIL